MKINSIKFHICVLYVGAIGISFIVYRGLLFFDLRHSLYHDFDYQLQSKAGQISKAIKAYTEILGKDDDSFVSSARRVICLDSPPPYDIKIRALDFQWVMQANKLSLGDDYIYLSDSQGRVFVKSQNIDAGLQTLLVKKVDVAHLNTERFTEVGLKKDGKFLRIISVPFLYNHKRYVLNVATISTQIIELLKKRMNYDAVLIPIILLLMVIISLIFVLRILKPVFVITDAAKNISYKNLSARVKAEHIEEEMKYLADAFNDMIARLEKSFNYITDFSSQVSHELKTPLSIIKGESELALKKERSNEEYKTTLKVVLEEARRMLKIINDLLFLAKLSYQSEVIQFEKFNLSEFLGEIYQEMNILSADKGIAISLNVPRQAFINGNKLHLRRLFYNLIDNAIKFTPSGGRIDILVTLEENKAKISVSDTGSGISKEDLPKIFRKFFVIDKQEKGGELIHGLGLNIVRHIVKIHHGEISVQSELGKGSTFTVIFPLA